MAPTPVSNFRLSPDLLRRVDLARGAESRTSFLVRALEAQLEREQPPVPRLVRRSSDAKAGVLPR